MTTPRRKTLLVSSALGVQEPDAYSSFLSSLRKHYSGDVVMAIATDASPEITSVLDKYNAVHNELDIPIDEQSMNIHRFELYSKYCTSEYDYCMTIDFR